MHLVKQTPPPRATRRWHPAFGVHPEASHDPVYAILEIKDSFRHLRLDLGDHFDRRAAREVQALLTTLIKRAIRRAH